MKKRVFYLLTILIALILFFLISNRDYILFRANNYKVYNEKREALPIYLINRANNKRDGNDTFDRELLLYIDKRINMRHQAYNNEVLTLHIDEAKLLETVGGRESFIKIGDFILLQTRANTGDDFFYLYNNGMAYTNRKEEPIQFFIAEGNTYKFNTFAGLKAYGDTIIIEKLDGPIEKAGSYIAGE